MLVTFCKQLSHRDHPEGFSLFLFLCEWYSDGSGVYIWGGGSGVALIAAGGTDLFATVNHP